MVEIRLKKHTICKIPVDSTMSIVYTLNTVLPVVICNHRMIYIVFNTFVCPHIVDTLYTKYKVYSFLILQTLYTHCVSIQNRFKNTIYQTKFDKVHVRTHHQSRIRFESYTIRILFESRNAEKNVYQCPIDGVYLNTLDFFLKNYTIFFLKSMTERSTSKSPINGLNLGENMFTQLSLYN